MNHPNIAIIMMFVMFGLIAVAVFAATLSHLILKASKMREENDLTI
jgi:hypothetical protein